MQDLVDIAKNKGITDGKKIDANEVWLFIAVPKDKLNDWANFATTLQNSGIPGIDKIKLEVFSMEKVLNI